MKKILLTVILLSSFLFAQEKPKQSLMFTGNLKFDSELSNQQMQPLQKVEPNLFVERNKKSPLLAAIFSLVVPGTGEIYSKSYLKAGIFLAVEATLITVGIIYNKKGDNQTNDFQNYADKNWSVVRYAQWIIDNKDYLGLTDVDQATMSKDMIISTDQNLPPWKQVDFQKLNYYESQIGKEGSGFTHKLPPHGDQQYFELIGKYYQYNPGWNDFVQNADYRVLTANFKLYSQMRGDANDLYNVSTKAVAGIYINHVLSALDAAWSTTIYNKEFAMQLRVKPYEMAEGTVLVPTVNFKIDL